MDRRWRWRGFLLLGAALTIALTWTSSVQWAASQEPRPQFSVDECPVPSGGYAEAERGHGAAPGGLVCNYHKEQAGEPLLENWQHLYVTYHSTPEEALEKMGRFVADDHVQKFLCETWDDCDRIDRVLLERTGSSMYGYQNTLTNDPINYSLERRFVDGTYTVSIFVQGEIFTGVDQAMAEVSELEAAARSIIDQPRQMLLPEPTAGTAEFHEQPPTPEAEPTSAQPPPRPEIDEDKIGMDCTEYCLSLEPTGFWLDGETYPDCTCDCGPGNAFVGLKCTSCTEMCAGTGAFLYQADQMECTCICDDPTKIWSRYRGECVAGPDKTGQNCEQYCAELVTGGVGFSEQTYPNCTCDCAPGELFLQSALQCVPCKEWCSGEGTHLIVDKDRPCACMCNDPDKKYDPVARDCVGLDGSECNGGHGCEPEFGENCLNCPDCVCSFGSPANRLYDQFFTCEPSDSRADIYGCVFNIPSEAEQLEIMREEWNQCRDAWLIMLWANVSPEQEVLSKLTTLDQVTNWQQKSGCVPTADGLVLQREAVDPMVCLMRYCDRINTGIHELEQRVEGRTPVIRGPGIKVSQPGANVAIGRGQTVEFGDRITIFGVRPASLVSPVGAGFAQSEYEITFEPDSGMVVYLFDGRYTHTYYDAAQGVARQEVVGPGEALSVGLDGVPAGKAAFDPDGRDAWWESVDYLVDCPDHAHQEGPDCFCDPGFVVDAALELCISEQVLPGIEPTDIASLATNPPPMVQVTVTPAGVTVTEGESGDQDGSDGETSSLLLIILGVIVVLVLLAVAALVWAIRRRR